MKRKVDNSNSSIGLHVAENRIHGVCLRCEAGRYEVGQTATLAFEGKLGDAGSRDAMSGILNRLDPPAECPIYLTSGFENFLTTHLTIADAQLTQMNQMAGMAFRQEMNVGTEDSVFDYERVGAPSAAAIPKVSLHAFSVEASRKETLCEVLETAGHQACAVFPEFFALRNVIAVQEPAGPVALLFLNHNELRIAVVHDKKYTFTRTFKSGQDVFLEYISKMVDQTLDFPALEQALDPDSDDYEDQFALEVRSAFSFVTERMQKQIERAFNFYTSRLKLPPVQQIYIYAGSRIVARNLATCLKPSYSFPVSILDVAGIECIQTPDELCSGKGMGYTLAAGAALAKTQFCPNLLCTHADQQQQRRTYRIKTAWLVTLGVLAFVCIGTFALQLALFTPRMLKKRTLERRIAEYDTHYTQEIMLAKCLLSQKRLLDLHAVAERYYLQGCFFELSHLLPPELKLEQFHIELAPTDAGSPEVVGTMRLQGLVVENGFRQQALLTKFLVELGNSSLFKNVSKIPVSPAEIKAYAELNALPFRISCDVVYGESPKPKKGKK
ncbi:MAG: pilus assembly protein PilM [Kiritimatiellaeota bacterium]|nr:pilus assembly protein PilM [Kiritimatiellota bacterium]